LDVNITSEIIKGVIRPIPLIAANMISVVDSDFVIKLYELGAFAFMHRGDTEQNLLKEVKKIAKKRTGVALVEPVSDCVGEEYYLTYKFTQKDTQKPGRYAAQFLIEFLDGSGNLIVPIKEELFINILEGSIKK
jgi:hypothetical protein